MPSFVLGREPDLRAKFHAFQYQTEAVEAIRDLDYGAIFHEQGLGKTKIALDIVLYWLEKRLVDTALLVLKKSLVDNWRREIKAHTYLSPLVLGTERRQNFYVVNSPTRLILTHYEAVRAEKKRLTLFLKSRSVGVILDESTKIKNPKSELARAFFELSPLFVRRVIMTGTPVANRPYDIWAQIFFLDHGRSLGTDFDSFRRALDLDSAVAHGGNARGRFENAMLQVNQRIFKFSVRESKASSYIELPEKIVKVIETDWEPRQHDLYLQMRDDLKAVVIRDGIPSEDRADDILKRLLRLVQIAANPALIDESYAAEPGKFPYLIDLVEDILRRGEKCIVWTTFTESADWLSSQLRAYGTRCVHGKHSIDDRNASVRVFLDDPDVRVLVATPGAAKEGLTLTVANHVIFYDRSFSLDDYLQAQDRIHRVSQTRTCYVYNLIMRDSIDEWIDILLHAKRLAAQLLQGDISHDFYKTQMTYSFSDVLRTILNVNHKDTTSGA
jgi:SNF2 family DNA or RNA helicase